MIHSVYCHLADWIPSQKKWGKLSTLNHFTLERAMASDSATNAKALLCNEVTLCTMPNQEESCLSLLEKEGMH